MEFFVLSVALIAGAYLLVVLMQRNLRQRDYARQLRAKFIGHADDLVGKPEFPEEHAAFLVALASMPGGALTRFMVFALFKQMVTGTGPKRRRPNLSVERVPSQLRAKYAHAVLTFALSDSYQCALLGPVFRGANSWIRYAVREVKPDVDAHATQAVVYQMAGVRTQAPSHYQVDFACA